MIVYGIDPGPKLHGWAILDVTLQKRVLLSAGRASTQEIIDQLGQQQVQLVAIEWASQVLGVGSIQRVRAISKTLIATQAEAGRLLQACETRGMKVVKISASDWRLGIVGTRSPTDKRVRESMGRLVTGAFPKEAGAHAYDAAGVALAAFNRGR